MEKPSSGEEKERLLVKFVEGDCEKCDRTVELCLKYDGRARVSEYRYYRNDDDGWNNDGAKEEEEEVDQRELSALEARLRGGADLYHRACAVIAFACVGSRRCRGHVMEQFRTEGAGVAVVKAGLAEFSSLLSKGSQKRQIEHYLSEM